MQTKFVRTPNRPVLIVAGLALLLLAITAIEAGAVNANHYRVPLIVLAESGIIDAFFGLALVYAALRKNQFAGATAVVIATFLVFGILMHALMAVTFRLPFGLGWERVLTIAIAGALLSQSIFPWSRSANKPVFFWMALTFGSLAILFGSVVLLARL
jgi:hypothetical protein